ncbi:MAG: DUF58 domain-containing protein [Oscillospiraceae bacterium]|nr:DUF58 domain-containing protein [Oscillospiraceae bacterium]
MSVALGWAAWLVLLAVVSIFSEANLLQLLLVLFIPILLISFAAVFIASRLFSVSFKEEAAGSKGEDVLLPIRVCNRSPIPLPRVSCRVRGKNKLTGEAFEQHLVFSVKANEERTVDCKICSDYCGRIEFEVDKIRLYEFFGLLFIPLSTSQKSGFTAMPLSFELLLLAVLERSIPEDSEEYSTKKAGSDPSEIFQIRDYRAGDSIRQIHWKLTQKFDSLLVKDASLPVEQSVLIVFDTHRDRGRAVSPACYDAAAEVLVSLCQALVDEGVSHRVAWRNAYTGLLEQAIVTTTDDIPTVLSGILAAPADDGISTLDLYRSEKGTPDVSHIFCISAAAPCVIDSTFEVSTTILCARENSGADEGDGVFYFGATTYQEDLSSLAF